MHCHFAPLLSTTSTVSSTYEITGSGVFFDLQFGELFKDKGIPRNGVVSLVVATEILPEATRGESVVTATTAGSGEESWPGDEQSAAIITVFKPSIFLPFVNH